MGHFTKMTPVPGHSRSQKRRRVKSTAERRRNEPSGTPRIQLPVWKKLIFGAVVTLLFFASLELLLFLAGGFDTLFNRLHQGNLELFLRS